MEAIDHWIAFALLAGVDLHMLYATFLVRKDATPIGQSLVILIATVIGTSLDAVAVGVSLAFLDVNQLRAVEFTTNELASTSKT